MEDIRGVRLRKFKLRKIILGLRMHIRHRPVSLTSHVGKILEAIVKEKLLGQECDSGCELGNLQAELG